MCSLPVDRSHSHLQHELLLIVEEFEFVEEIFHCEERSKSLTRTWLTLLNLTCVFKFDATETKLCQTFAKLPPLGVTGARDISPASPFYSLTLMLPTEEGNTAVAR